VKKEKVKERMNEKMNNLKRRKKVLSEEDIANIIEAFKLDKTLTKREIADKYQIPLGTLYRRLNEEKVKQLRSLNGGSNEKPKSEVDELINYALSHDEGHGVDLSTFSQEAIDKAIKEGTIYQFSHNKYLFKVL
jgi:ribosomal protein S25